MGDNDSAARGKKLLCVKSFHEINMLFLVKFLYLPTAKLLFNCIKENGGATYMSQYNIIAGTLLHVFTSFENKWSLDVLN